MSSLLSLTPNLVFSPISRTPKPLFYRTHFADFSYQGSSRRAPLLVAKFGFKSSFFPDPYDVDGMKELFGRLESVVYKIADAAVSSSDSVVTSTTVKQNSNWFSGITNSMETVLKPTLHKPSIMAHVVRVLKGQKTIRMHYANYRLTTKEGKLTLERDTVRTKTDNYSPILQFEQDLVHILDVLLPLRLRLLI